MTSRSHLKLYYSDTHKKAPATKVLYGIAQKQNHSVVYDCGTNRVYTYTHTGYDKDRPRDAKHVGTINRSRAIDFATPFDGQKPEAAIDEQALGYNLSISEYVQMIGVYRAYCLGNESRGERPAHRRTRRSVKTAKP